MGIRLSWVLGVVPILAPEDLLFQLVLVTPLGFASWCASPGDEQWDLPRERENISHLSRESWEHHRLKFVSKTVGDMFVLGSFFFNLFLDD